MNCKEAEVHFESKSGRLTVSRRDGLYWLDFPAKPPETIPVPKLIPEALGTVPLYTGVNTDLLVLVQNEEMVRTMRPDLLILKKNGSSRSDHYGTFR